MLDRIINTAVLQSERQNPVHNDFNNNNLFWLIKRIHKGQVNIQYDGKNFSIIARSYEQRYTNNGHVLNEGAVLIDVIQPFPLNTKV